MNAETTKIKVIPHDEFQMMEDLNMIFRGQFTEIDPDRAAKIEVMPDELLDEVREEMNKKACYNNSIIAAIILAGLGHETSYVIGYAHREGQDIHIDHAWIKVDGVYYDPTWQLFSTIDNVLYGAMYAVPHEDFYDLLSMFEYCPPSCFQMEMMHHQKTAQAKKIQREEDAEDDENIE